MPKIIIKEIDNTKAAATEYANFTVVIPGFVEAGNRIPADPDKGTPAIPYGCYDDGTSVFDDFNIYECNSQADFSNYIGKVQESETTPGIGNQIAYELLGIGYTILYKKLDATTEYESKTGINAMETDEFWEPLKDKSTYDFRMIISGLKKVMKVSTDTDVMKNIANKMIALADFNNASTSDTGRGDCVALCDIDSYYYTGSTSPKQSAVITNIKTVVAGLTTKSKYGAMFAPTVTYAGVNGSYTNKTFPASFHYLACFAKARANNFAEWYAAAGYTRGVCDYTVVSTGYPFGEGMIDALEPRTSGGIVASVNVVTKIKGSYYLWGNRTLEQLGEELTASHFLNIRQLCCTLKKQIYITCKSLTFDPNSDLLWTNFCNAIRPTLEKMKANQGISDYKFIKEASKKATLKALIRIVPIEAVEDFDISVSLEDSLNGTVISED